MPHDPGPHPAPRTRRQGASLPVAGTLSYIGVFRAEPVQRIDMIKAGIPASEAKRILADLAVNQAAGYRALDLSPATMNRKVRDNGRLPPAESERVLGAARLTGQIQAIVEASGNPKSFDAAAWLSRWLSEPLPALGGVSVRHAGHHRGPGPGVRQPRPHPGRRPRVTWTVWRIATDAPTCEADDMTGAGAKLTGGRWSRTHPHEARRPCVPVVAVHHPGWQRRDPLPPARNTSGGADYPGRQQA